MQGRSKITTSVGVVVALTSAYTPVAFAAPPTWDHVVVVVEENHSQTQIIGNTGNGGSTDGAPYINALAEGGVRFNNMFAIMHPSQPNYLELFSGSNQNMVTNDLPPGMSSNTPFSTPNLGAEVIAAGRTFAGYSEALPSTALDADSTIAGGYRRKHNPWVNWTGNGPHRIPVATNKSFSAFPSDFTQLPHLSYVVPTQFHDMHDDDPSDGLTPVRAGDNWLRDNIQSYANWAATHNSLLIVTWDEDGGNEGNRIPTVLYGANIKNGTQDNSTWTLHNLLRTLEDSNGTSTHAGQANKTRSIVGPFTTGPAVERLRFQDGINNYTGTHDTSIRQDNPTAILNGAVTNSVDADADNDPNTGKTIAEGLIRFDIGFGGEGPGQVPAGAIIQSAKLVIRTSAGGSDVSEDAMELHRMLVDWNTSTASWNASTFGGNGVQANDIEAASAETFHITADGAQSYAVFDITDEVLGWQAGTITNYGWMINGFANGQDGWTWNSDNATTFTDRPMLEIVYSVPEPGSLAALAAGAMLIGRRRRTQ
jgi:hypothetical protein